MSGEKGRRGEEQRMSRGGEEGRIRGGGKRKR